MHGWFRIAVALLGCVALGPHASAADQGPAPGASSRPAAARSGAGEEAGAASSARSRSGLTAASRPAEAMRDVAYVDLVLLVKNARRAFRAKVEGLPERSARYHPPALAGMRGIVHLTLRRGGAVLAEAESGEMDVVDASVAAGALLGQAVISKGLACERGGDGWGLELEWLGPQEPIVCRFYDEGGRWSDALLHAFEPAAEGIGVAFRGRRGWTRPSEVISRGYTPDLALAAAEKAIGLRHTQKVRFAKEIRYFRFRARHLWQPDARALPIVLVRGDALVEPEAVTPTGLDAAIDRMGRYLHYRQNRNGEFSHEYVCSGDRYHPGNSARVQLRALIGLADFAAWSGRAEVRADAVKGVDRFSTFLRPLTLYAVDEAGRATTRPAGLALAPAGHSHRLEISAALLSALAMVRPESADDERYRGLVAGILSAQREDGAIVLAVEAGTDPAASEPRDVAACRALLALSRAQADRADPRIERAILRSVAYYKPRLDTGIDPAAAAALARALALLYIRTNDARLSDLTFLLLDRFAAAQVRPEACPYPELRGAIQLRGPGLVGADTALYLAALADGLALAERIGDAPRVARYREAVAAASRFVMQLEVRQAGCYCVRSPRDAVGGVRSAPWSSRLRADHCADAVTALIQARTALFGGHARP